MSALCLLTASGAEAATFTVTRTDDRNAVCAANIDCSLREAINAANGAAGSDTIDFDASVGTVQLAAVLPSITTTIIINGGSGVTVSGDAAIFTFRAFTITATGNLSLDNITVTNAKEMIGGGLFNQNGGTVSLTNCIISGNLATSPMSGGNGGGIFNAGMMTLANTVVNVNSAASQGGGILNNSTGVMTLTDSTVSFNDADTAFGIGGGGISNSGMLTVNRSTIYGNLTNGNGGGVFNLSGTINLTNSTVSFNSAFANAGGGIFNGNGGTVNITNSTITDQNTATLGGGIATGSGGDVVNLRNTIVAGNNAPTAPDVTGNYNTPAFNLIGKSDGSTGFTNGVNGNIVGTIAMPVDPLLAPIANNGGATQTYALMSGSPAVNTGSNALAVDPLNAPLTTDQRGAGFPRILGGRVDIGSFESAFIPTAASISVGGKVITPEGRGIAKARVTLTGASGISRPALTGAFGYYRFDNVEVGQTYIISVQSKRYSFDSLVLVVNDKLSDVDFVGFLRK